MVPPVACPLCSVSFPPDQVNAHASYCNGSPPLTSLKIDGKRKIEDLPQSPANGKKIASLFMTKKAKTEKEDDPENLPEPHIGKPPTENVSTQQKRKAPVPIPPAPLAERMRPSSLSEWRGQELLSPQLRSLLLSPSLPSLVLWGPPGCGKTSLANIIAEASKGRARFVRLSACSAGVAEVREVVKQAKSELAMLKRRTILFMDEVHRFSKAQQDSFLPHIEAGVITFIGATTENPSFSLNSALLSRCRVVELQKLGEEALLGILGRALEEGQVKVSCEALNFIANSADGDARFALNNLQLVLDYVKEEQEEECEVGLEKVREVVQKASLAYDKSGDSHYTMASALQKAIRGSSDSAALYWLARMLRGGEDPLFIARRLVRCAAEDVGLADPSALPLAVAAMQGTQLLGKPECDVLLAQACTYLARAPKSHEVYHALGKAYQTIDTSDSQPGVPLHLRNSTSSLTRQQGWGKGYSSDLSEVKKIDYMPPQLKGLNFFK